MNDIQVPVWEKYAMTVEEASQYFSVGQNKIRQFTQQDRFGNWYMMNGNRLLIKKKQFEKMLDKLDTI